MITALIPANTPIPISKDSLINILSRPSVVSGGSFVVMYPKSDLLYANTLNNVLSNTNSISGIEIDSQFNDISYKASVKGYELPNKSIKIVYSDILSYLNYKEIPLKNSFPLSDGGVALDFRINSIKYLVELFNDNEDVFSIEEPHKPIKAWDLNHSKLLKKVIFEIK